MPHHLTRPKLKVSRQFRPQLLWQIAHRLEAFGPTAIHPFANLRGTKRRLAALREPAFQQFPGLGIKQMRHSCIIQATSQSPSVQSSMSSRKLPSRVAAPASKEIDVVRAHATVLDLMAIPAKSGEEAPVAAYIRERLLAAG